MGGGGGGTMHGEAKFSVSMHAAMYTVRTKKLCFTGSTQE